MPIKFLVLGGRVFRVLGGGVERPSLFLFGSAKTDPVRFKRGFGEGRLKDEFLS